MRTKLLIAGAGLAAIAATTPATAQYPYGYYPPYGGNYGAPYGNAYGYYGQNANLQQMAASQCSAAVQARLNNRTSVGGILGSMVGLSSNGRVLSVTQVTPRSNRIRVRGFASSGRMAYNPYGAGYYGALGSNYANAADLSFRCEVDYRGRVRDVDIDRRR